MCQYLPKIQFGKKQEGKENEILKTLWQMTKFLVPVCCCCCFFVHNFNSHLPSWSWARPNQVHFISYCSASASFRTNFTCASATSSLYRLKDKYWSKLRSDIRLIFVMCVRAHWVIFVIIARLRITFTIYVSKRFTHSNRQHNMFTKSGAQISSKLFIYIQIHTHTHRLSVCAFNCIIVSRQSPPIQQATKRKHLSINKIEV